jgi:hypothetical protein
MNPAEMFGQLEMAKSARATDAHAAQVALPALLSGEATWLALEKGIEEMVSLAPQDHDVLIWVGDVRVLKGRFIHPHSFVFEGLDRDGHNTRIIIHFSQLNARIVALPKQGNKRAISILAGAA